MKQKEFIRQLIKDGCIFLRTGANHDLYINSVTGQKQPVPRHTEIDNNLVKHIRKHLGLK
ncbi:type II toxin-antitoxin system HicA family toxin [bacterium]|nr:type II toxin-antitoxin system HicA family toxin [bacterium]MBU1753861.1 type II toxin-antitoxin system HicA family toxin [bacterium]